MTEAVGSLESSYDAVPYPGAAYPLSHPDRMAAVARLHGLNPPDIRRCRVLELGCGTGENLLPLALRFTEADFVGVDLSRVQVDTARETAAALGLGNITFEQADLTCLDASLGEYDYIIAHGVYSWVPQAVRDSLMALCRRHLAPQGIAYVSYNVYPGWRTRSVVREALMFHLQGVEDPGERIEQARALLDFLRAAIPDSNSAYRTVFDHVAGVVARDSAQENSLLFHDLLEGENNPTYFTSFVEHAASQGLRFLGEAEPSDMCTELYGEQVATTLAALGEDVVRREQYIDFIANRSFRQSLLCRDDAPLQPTPRADALAELALACKPKTLEVAGSEREASVLRVRDVGGNEGEVRMPLLRAMLLVAAEHWPGAASWPELARLARMRATPPGQVVVQPAGEYDAEEQALREGALQMVMLGVLEPWTLPPALLSVASEQPRASAWARFRIERGLPFCNLRNEPIEFADLTLSLLRLLDGSRDRQALIDEMVRLFEEQGLVLCAEGELARGGPRLREGLTELLPRQLRMLAQAGLLDG